MDNINFNNNDNQNLKEFYSSRIGKNNNSLLSDYITFDDLSEIVSQFWLYKHHHTLIQELDKIGLKVTPWPEKSFSLPTRDT